MSFLTVNGLVLPVTSTEVAIQEIGDRARAFDGTMRSTFIAQKRAWKCVTQPLLPADADFWSAVIRGLGDLFPLESGDVWSSKGAQMTGGLASSSAPGFYASTSGTTLTTVVPFVYPQAFPAVPSASSSTPWSMFWRQVTQANPSNFDSYAITFDGTTLTTYKNGAVAAALTNGAQRPALTAALAPIVQTPVNGTSYVTRANSTAYVAGVIMEPAAANGSYYVCTTGGTSAAAPPTFLTSFGSSFSDGTVTWQCVGAKTVKIGALLQLPLCLSVAQVATLHGMSSASSAKWPATPRLSLGGDVVNGAPSVLVTGMVDTDRPGNFGALAGGLGRVLELTLQEV